MDLNNRKTLFCDCFLFTFTESHVVFSSQALLRLHQHNPNLTWQAVNLAFYPPKPGPSSSVRLSVLLYVCETTRHKDLL